jgi:hypothetical protein
MSVHGFKDYSKVRVGLLFVVEVGPAYIPELPVIEKSTYCPAKRAPKS